MKIAFIGQKGIPANQGGVERYTEELATRIRAFGHEVFVYSRTRYTGSKEKEYKGVKLINLPSIPSKNLEAISHTLIATLDVLRKDYDIVHYQGVGPSTLALIVKYLKPSTKVVTTFQCRDQFHQKWGYFAKKYLAFGERAVCLFADKTIVVSRILQKYCKDSFLKETVLIPNGVSIKETNRTDLLEKLGLSKGNYIFTATRLIEHKGLHYLIEAFNNLDTDLKLVIAGDASYTNSYAKQIKELAKSNKNIQFIGMRTGEELAQLFTNAKLYVHPSEAEGLPITILEALKYGIPLVISDIPENIEASGGYAYLFKSKDAKELEKKITYVLNDIELAKAVAEVGKRYVTYKYDWDEIAAAVEKVYEDVALPKPLLETDSNIVIASVKR